MPATSPSSTQESVAPDSGGGTELKIVSVLAVLAIIFNRRLAPTMRWDWLNVIPLLAALYLGYCLVALKKIVGSAGYVGRCLSDDPKVPKPAGAFLFSPWFRSILLIFIFLLVAEFGLRCFSYHRALLYERQGDLLFTPVPNQQYVEKISLTSSVINSYGLRGGPVPESATQAGKPNILCLGDSVTYGYGVNDDETYPADLQRDLDQAFPGRYTVLNGGVDAYPIALEEQKFLYLWNRGLRPETVLVGYSFNEGGIGLQAASGDARIKDQIEARVKAKNKLRSIALYTLVVENWARHYYDRIKGRLVPGTNFTQLSETEAAGMYDEFLERAASDLRAHSVKPVFVLFAGFDGRTGRYDDQGAFQQEFAHYAEKNSIPLFRTAEALAQGEPQGSDLHQYFIDHAHMSEQGTQKVAAALAQFLPKVLGN
ncbi:MAG TPA: GDSL-type esterase/lipase family protein [Terriglobales bacterium]